MTKMYEHGDFPTDRIDFTVPTEYVFRPATLPDVELPPVQNIPLPFIAPPRPRAAIGLRQPAVLPEVRPERPVRPDRQPPQRKQKPERPRKPPRQPEASPEQPSRKRKVGRQLGRFALKNKFGAALTVSALTAGIFTAHWLSSPDAPETIKDCTDAGHQLVMIGDNPGFKQDFRHGLNSLSFGSLANDNWTWSTLAARLSSTTGSLGRGYDISPTELAYLNAPLATYKDGKLVDNISYRGAACVTEPGPQFPGMVVTNGTETVGDYVSDYMVGLAKVQRLNVVDPTILKSQIINGMTHTNPGLTGNPQQVLPAGMFLKLGKTNTHFVMREMTEAGPWALTHGNAKLGHEINDINPLSAAVKHGQHVFLPFEQTPAMKKLGITPADIVHEYLPAVHHMPQEQTLAPKHDKPVLPPKKPNILPGTPANLAHAKQLFSLLASGQPEKYAKLTIMAKEKYAPDIPLAVLRAQQYFESADGENQGPSTTGAIGVTQQEPYTFNETKHDLGWPRSASPWNAKWDIEAQAYYDQKMFNYAKRYANGNHRYQLKLALAAYNAGFGRVEQAGGMPSPAYIGTYVPDILGFAGHVGLDFHALNHNKNPWHHTSTGQTVPTWLGHLAYFSQTDNRWTYDNYSQHNVPGWNIGLNGCAPTQEASILSTLTGLNIPPTFTAKFNMENGYIIPDAKGGGTDGEAAIKAQAKLFGLKTVDLSPSDRSGIESVLKKGGLIAVAGVDKDPSTVPTSAGHDYEIRGETKDGKWLVGDPASISNSEKPLTTYQVFGSRNVFTVGVYK